MIRIELKRSGGELRWVRITGHADAGPKGHDLVCAAISSIATGALNALHHTHAHATSLLHETTPALIQIEVTQPSKTLNQVLEFLLIQLQTVAEAHPKHVHIKE
jgi:uncharacterized protein YsxB (DUF464 family)